MTKEERNKERWAQYYQNNKEKVKEYSAAYAKTQKGKDVIKQARSKYYASPKGKAKKRVYLNARALDKKLKLFELMGGKCTHCGFSDHRALQLDHINSDGSEDRKKSKVNGGDRYHMLANNPELRVGLQLLCANCNWIKRWTHEELYLSSKTIL